MNASLLCVFNLFNVYTKNNLPFIINVYTISCMKITYDESKNQRNIEKHGVSFEKVKNLDWDSLMVIEDTRYDYNEQRYIGYAIKNNRLYCLVYTNRGDAMRIISFRKANKREVINYASNY